jgi:hypothetical protein
VKVTSKEAAGNDSAVHAVISEPAGVVTYGAIKKPRIKIETAGSVDQKNGICLVYHLSARARQGFSDRLHVRQSIYGRFFRHIPTSSVSWHSAERQTDPYNQATLNSDPEQPQQSPMRRTERM